MGVDHLCISIKPSAIRLSVLVITDYHVWCKCVGCIESLPVEKGRGNLYTVL